MSGDRATAAVTGDDIDSVAFFLDGKHITDGHAAPGRRPLPFTVTCKHLRLGAHRARAVVTFDEDDPARQTLRFQITRSRQGAPRFAG